jgi:hypothetical protein
MSHPGGGSTAPERLHLGDTTVAASAPEGPLRLPGVTG